MVDVHQVGHPQGGLWVPNFHFFFTLSVLTTLVANTYIYLFVIYIKGKTSKELLTTEVY